jgi:transposase
LRKRSQKARLRLTDNQLRTLRNISRSRKAPAAMVERSKILLQYAGGAATSLIVNRVGTTRGKVARCIEKALSMGMNVALKDLPRSGRPSSITTEAEAWLTDLACQKPKELGYSYELWTTQLLADHAQKHCRKAGHTSLKRIRKGTVSKILSRHKLKPHKVRYYLQLRDPNFDERMAEVIQTYQQAKEARKAPQKHKGIAFLSYDEKPGIQAIANTAPDLPPVPGRHRTWSRDHEYKRLGTMSLMAAIDLVSGRAHHQLVNRHRSREFVAFLKQVIDAYPPRTKFRIVLDNHSAHLSAEVRKYLATVPNRFEFVFTPKHASWLNLIEVFFSKMARTVLRGLRVESKTELRQRIRKYFKEVNRCPVVFTWKYMLDQPVATTPNAVAA